MTLGNVRSKVLSLTTPQLKAMTPGALAAMQGPMVTLAEDHGRQDNEVLAGWLEHLRKLCDRTGALLVVGTVMVLGLRRR